MQVAKAVTFDIGRLDEALVVVEDITLRFIGGLNALYAEGLLTDVRCDGSGPNEGGILVLISTDDSSEPMTLSMSNKIPGKKSKSAAQQTPWLSLSQ